MNEKELDRRNQYLQFRELLREYKRTQQNILHEFYYEGRDKDFCSLGFDLANRIRLFKAKER